MNWKHTAIAAAIMLCGVLLTQFVGHGEDVALRRPLSEFPNRIADWEGRQDRFDQQIYDVLGVDDSYLANYLAPEGRPVQLYIGFYQSQRKGDIIHSPKNCMPGAGRKIVKTKLHEFVPEGALKPAKVIQLTLENGGRKQAMLYWFQSRGRVISSEYWQKIYLVIDSVLRGRTDGSFVRLIAPVSDKGETEAFQDLTEFASHLMPILEEFIPS
ncbi:MAG: exosortase C-terminal domain/associated protein EpsI [Thermodesulfobacteriota bacterium]